MKTLYRYPVFLLTLAISISVNGQVYNYDPVRHTNAEANPAYLASGRYRFTSSVTQQGNPFIPGKFYQEAVKLSVYSQKYFVGLGLVSALSHINDSTNYRYVGIGAAYRTILLDKIYTRIGFMYKIIGLLSPPGNFTYYSFDAGNAGRSKQQINENINASVSFSSATDKYYISGGVLNYRSPLQAPGSSSFFPQYYFANLGDFARILGIENWEISYTAFIKKYTEQKSTPFSQYLLFLNSGLRISRYSGIRYGARVGITDNTYLQYSPMLSYYYGFSRRKSIACNFLVDMSYHTTTRSAPFKPNAQINLTYIF
ncbi:MAG TPA: hypothetical protein VNY73_07610 [Bacteroidia bacterium]|jgi:hypothetical protein|nr:hypothetical protein [Bacteroidia bacterium]